MVITYSNEELNAIGEKVALREIMRLIELNNNHSFQQDFNPFHQIGLAIRESAEIAAQPNGQQQQQLTNSVADFFKKAQQNFYAQAPDIDPKKVKSLSEVEAELIGHREPL